MHYLEIGGAETALIGMLNAIDYSHVAVDLFLYSHRGEIMQFIPKEVNLLPEIKEYAHIECPMKQALVEGCWGVLYGRLKAKWLTKKYMRKKGVTESAAGLQYVASYVSPYLPSLYQYGEYDLAISFLNPHNYVIDKVKAKKKICWIHTDYTSIDINVEQELPVWNAYDRIVSISPDVTMTFLRVFPSLKNKIIEMENIIPSELVRERANEFDVSAEMPRNDNTINLLSVGRFCEAKNYDNVPDICRRILSSVSTSVKWFIIGYGSDEQLIRDKIRAAGMENNVILLGKKTNPYPYMKACDIYVQPSRYEGKSVTVREAQILCKPVVVTDYPTASSQVNDGLDGVIVPMDNLACANGIVKLIEKKSKQEAIIQYLHTHNYGNETEVDKLYKFL
jgi:glycosyltransferase involved in cell wall biosynthesis